MQDQNTQRRRPIRVLFLTSGDRVPSTRFRILPFIEHLERDGIRCYVASSVPQKYDFWPIIGFRPSQKIKRIVRWCHWLMARLLKFDVVLIEREIFNDDTTSMEERFRRIARRIVLDVDDAVFLRHPEKFEKLTRMADLVIAGNPQLRDVLGQWNDRIEIIPTGVRLAHFPEKDRSQTENEIPIIGWMGTTANLEYFKVLAPALRELSRRIEFEMRFIVPDISPLESIDLSGVRVKHVAWNGATEVAELRKIDIGVMPLYPDREWDRFKCPTKMIQYMAIAVPGVASPVGFTADVVQHGENGFLATTTDEWVSALEQLLIDPALRIRIGTAGRESVRRSFCVEANQRVFADALRAAAD